MRKLLEPVCQALADQPQQIRVNQLTGTRTEIIEIRCADGDRGKLIGKNGRTVESLRALAGALAAKDGRRAVLEVAE